MGFDYNFYTNNFGSQYLREKPGTSKEFQLNVPGLDIDESLQLRVVQIWNFMFEHDEDISAIFLGNKVLYKGNLSEYDGLIRKIDNLEYELGLDENADFYMIYEAEIIQ